MDHPVLGNDWMAWNLFLALIPALLAVRLFRPEAERRWTWWLGLATFIAFLPNAPYVLTDVVHLPEDLQTAAGSTRLTLAVLVLYAGFAVVGFFAYAYSVLRLLEYMRAQGAGALALISTELSVHVLATVGIILGRVFRFNSWDLLRRPEDVFEAVRVPQTQRGIGIVLLLMVALAVGTLVVRAAVGIVRRTTRIRI